MVRDEGPSVVKAAKFLKATEKEAEERILNRILFGTTGFEAQLVTFEQNLLVATYQVETYLAFKLNGQPHKLRLRSDRDHRPEEIAHEVAHAVAAEVMTQVFANRHWTGV